MHFSISLVPTLIIIPICGSRWSSAIRRVLVTRTSRHGLEYVKLIVPICERRWSRGSGRELVIHTSSRGLEYVKC